MTQKKFSTAWKKSTRPRKQRLYRYSAPLHVKQKLMHVHLSKELRQKYSKRNVQVRVGDKVKILRGQFAKREGKVERIDLKRERVFVTGMEIIKKDGTKIPSPLEPSNMMIIDLILDDKKRKHKLEEHGKVKSESSKQEKVVKKEVKIKNKGEK